MTLIHNDGSIMRIRHALAILAAAGLMTSEAQAGDVFSRAAEKLRISGYTQARYAYWDNVPDNLVNSGFFVTRARIKWKAELTRQAWWMMEIDFVSSRMVKDAIVAVDVSRLLTIQAGQFKRPISQEEMFSSSAVPVINRGLTNRVATRVLGYIGRSQGLMAVVGNPKHPYQASLGIFSGAGEADVSIGDELFEQQTDLSNRGKDVVGRLAGHFGRDTRVRIATGGSTRNVGGNYTDTAGVDHRSRTFIAWGADTRIVNGPWSIWAEALLGDNWSDFTDTMTVFSAPTFLGWQIAANWHKKVGGDESLITAVQPEARYDALDPNLDTGNDALSLVTGGISLFFGELMRWRTNVEWHTYQDDRPNETRFISELQAKI